MSATVNAQLARVFGLEGKCATRFTLRAEAGRAPEMTVTFALIDGAQFAEQEQAFELRPITVGDECEQAMARVQAWIDRFALEASRKIRDDHLRAISHLAARRTSDHKSFLAWAYQK